ncbi:MAG: archease [Nanoarchaeota archaeon]|nr:archease [Nanoarchaeota archaeon]
MYEQFEHKADVGVRGLGRTVEKSFEECARAMYAVMTDLSSVKPVKIFNVECGAENVEELLVEWLNSLITLTDTHNYFFSEFKVKIENNKLNGSVKGEKINPKKHELLTEVKAATYSQLKVFKKGKNWIAQTVVDV